MYLVIIAYAVVISASYNFTCEILPTAHPSKLRAMPLPHEAFNSCSKPRASLPLLHPKFFSSVTYYTSLCFTSKLNGAVTPILDFKLHKGRD